MSGSDTSVFGIYSSRAAVEHAVESLRDVGFRSVDISVLFPANVGARDFGHEKATKAPEGATAGGGTGALVGGALMANGRSSPGKRSTGREPRTSPRRLKRPPLPWVYGSKPTCSEPRPHSRQRSLGWSLQQPFAAEITAEPWHAL